MKASIVITTKNRKEELRRALASAISQAVPVEIIVMDDGSSDGTLEMVRSEFPTVKLHRFEESKGLIVRRNEGARLASGDIIFSIDDDAEFSTSRVIEKTLSDFSSPVIGAVAIPYIEPRRENRVMQMPPDAERIWVTDTYIGTAHALRRDVFLSLGGYREHLIHQGEEGDFCLRMLDRGYVVRLGNAEVIIHHDSPKRDFSRMDFYGRRNDILFALNNVPMPYLPPHLAATTLKGARFAMRTGRFKSMTAGIFSGYSQLLKCVKTRRAVRPATYKQFRLLRKRGPMPLDRVQLLH